MADTSDDELLQVRGRKSMPMCELIVLLTF
jgi:hypothetical protein